MQITADILYNAYAQGIFPMAASATATALQWYDPDPRGILPLDTFHVPKSLIKLLRQQPFTVTVNRDFTGVMQGCAAPDAAKDRATTWINDEIVALYTELHRQGRAHSVEVWREGQLAGGLYGVAIGGAFCGESMFSRVSGASKVALVHLVARLKARGYLLCDTQFTTEHLARFGGCEIPRAEYHLLLARALKLECQFVGDAADASAAGNAALLSTFLGCLQSTTATS